MHTVDIIEIPIGSLITSPGLDVYVYVLHLSGKLTSGTAHEAWLVAGNEKARRWVRSGLSVNQLWLGLP